MQLNDVIELNIENLSSEGAGIGRKDGMVIFVGNAVKGDRIRAKITALKKNFAEAEMLELLKPVANRIKPCCADFAACGGCALQMLNTEKQAEFKAETVQNALKHIGGIDIDLPKINQFEPWHYRNRVQWHCHSGRLGFYNQNSHNVVYNENCLLLPDVFNALSSFLNNEIELPQSLYNFTLQADENNSRLMAVFCADKNKVRQETALYKQLSEKAMSAFPQLASCFLNLTSKRSILYGSEFLHLAGEKALKVKICGSSLLLYPGAFLQVNFKACKALYNKVLELAGKAQREKIWDIYCGIGALSLLLSQKAGQVTGIEYCLPAVKAAEKNAALNSISNCEFVCGRAEKILPQEVKKGGRAELAVLDPPRAGCAPEVIVALLTAAPANIIYISCNPATLARDLKLLSRDYQMENIECFDLFLQTVHVETVALMSRKDA